MIGLRYEGVDKVQGWGSGLIDYRSLGVLNLDLVSNVPIGCCSILLPIEIARLKPIRGVIEVVPTV